MMNGKPPMTQTAASIFQEICYSNKDRLSYVLASQYNLWTSLCTNVDQQRGSYHRWLG
jgi:hypothetical protein